MSENPYKILGVKEGASYDEIKRAYRDMVKKYHPDKYKDNPLADLADVKMREINEAYDRIMKNSGGAYQYQYESGDTQDYNSYQSGGSSNNQGSQTGNQNSQSGNQKSQTNQNQTNNGQGSYGQTGNNTSQQSFNQEASMAVFVRNSLNTGNLTEAQRTLDKMQNKNAEWFYLQGLVFIRKGWSDRAYASFQRAVSMDPTNFEYRNALNGMNNQFQGYRQQYQNRSPANNPDMCQICGTLWCADSCCECMGGDMIGCC